MGWGEVHYFAGGEMNNREYVLPTSEMREDMPPAFVNGDDDAESKDLTRRAIAEMAFLSVFADTLGAPELAGIEKG
jgi:hypothetical protein